MMYKSLCQAPKEDLMASKLLPTGHPRHNRHSKDFEVRQKIIKAQRPRGAQRRERSGASGQDSPFV